VAIISAIFRKESLKYVNEEPIPDPTSQKWLHIYRHPMEGLRQIQVQREYRLLQHLPPEKRVSAAVSRNNAWLVEELAIRGTPCEVRNVSGVAVIMV